MDRRIILLTFDYELFMKESGSLEKVLIIPTNQLRETLNKHNVKATFFVDILYYKRLIENSIFQEHAELFKDQLQTLLKEGHRLELHLHPQWQQAEFDGNQWNFPENMTYMLQSLPTEDSYELFKIGKKLLEDICRPIISNYEVLAFRAGGLCITPFDILKNAFTDFNIKIDSSVAKGLLAETIYQYYNYKDAPDNEYYRFENDPLIIDNSGNFIELPISVYNKNILDKIKERLFVKGLDKLNIPFSQGEGKTISPSTSENETGFQKLLINFTAYKMPLSLDFTYSDLILDKIKKSDKISFNLLSHCKLISKSSIKTIEKLVEQKYNFYNIEEFYLKHILNKNKTLILITGHFPYDVFEGYLEEEILLLGKIFKEIIIISRDPKGEKMRELPENFTVYRINSLLKRKENILESFYSIFDRELYSEIFQIIKSYKRYPNQKILADIFSTMNSGKKIYKKILEIIKEKNLNSNDIILYSYWFDKCAYAISKAIQNKKAYAAISRAHSYDIYLWRNENNYLPLKKYFLENISSLYFISEHGKKYFEDLYKDNKFDFRKLKLSKLGTFNNTNFNDKITSSKTFVILSCSNILKIKRIDKIIEALELINDIKIEWIHIGYGWQGWQGDEYANELIKSAQTLLGNKQNISYKFIGRLAYDKVLEYYKENFINLFINVSETEGLPVSIMEAMSFGIPVVATSVGGTPEIVNNKNGILLSANPTKEEISEAIIKMNCLTGDEILQFRKNAYATWSENYNAEENYKKFVEELSKL